MKVSSGNQIVTITQNSLSWVHSAAPSTSLVNKLSQDYDIPLSVLTEALDEQEKPRVYPIDNNMVIVFKLPFEDSGNATISIAFFLTKKGVISVATKKIPWLEKLFHNEGFLERAFKKNNINLLYEILEEINNQFFKIIDSLEDNLDIIEKQMFTTQNKSIMKKLYKVKKTLIYFHKSLSNNREVASSLEKGQNISITESKKFRLVYDDIVQMLDMISLYREIVTTNTEIYLTMTNNNLNHIMKRLTAGASLVLVPTFITGLYGMNFVFMPEIAWKYGYLFAWALIIGSMIALWIYFKKKEYL